MNLCSADNAAKSADFCPLKSPGSTTAIRATANKTEKPLQIHRKAAAGEVFFHLSYRVIAEMRD